MKESGIDLEAIVKAESHDTTYMIVWRWAQKFGNSIMTKEFTGGRIFKNIQVSLRSAPTIHQCQTLWESLDSAVKIKTLSVTTWNQDDHHEFYNRHQHIEV